MCELATAGLVVSVIGGVLQAKQQSDAGKAAARSELVKASNAQAEANYRAEIANNNQIRANYLAEDALARGQEAERDERLRGRLLVGQMRAVLAASGQEVDEGSALGLVVDQSQTNELNSRTVRNNAAREAQEFRIRASQFGNESALSTRAGENAITSGQFDAQRLRTKGRNAATSTLISTAGSVANKWYQLDKAGAFA